MLRTLKAAAVTLSVCGFLAIPDARLFAGQPAGPQTPARKAHPAATAIDVALSAGNTLNGRVLDSRRRPVAGTKVLIRQGRRTVATAVTDSAGGFQIQNLRPGIYQVVAADGVGLFRVWAPKAAPPSARDQALLVSGAVVFRGQSTYGVVYADEGDVLYDENGVPYGQVRVMDEGPVYCPPGGGFFSGLDPLILTTTGAAVAAAVLAGIALDKINHVEDDVAKIPKSP
ncbi:MAG: carboxypeptidase regulatory-like domain-containing protein [Planctomycetes bacterium]|nr:carboxypeptidase regulatory-like domain-containing protein [Planctomycetota bacterium]